MKAGSNINIEFYKSSFRMPNFPIHPKTILEKIKKKDEEERENFWKFANFKNIEVHLALADLMFWNVIIKSGLKVCLTHH
jgi:hypothetical protein